MSIIIFLIILVVLIVSHEFGHFIVAKWAGIRVDEFAIGFPPRLWSAKKGETEYTVNALPFGGYVKIFGENPNEESLNGPDKSRSFVNQPKRIQAAVVVAGVFFNLLLAWLLLSVGFMLGYPASIEGSGYKEYAKNPALTVTSVFSGAPAEGAGLMPGDKIISFSSGGEVIAPKTPEDLQAFIQSHGNSPVMISYERAGEIKETNVVPREGLIPNKPAIGITSDVVGLVTLPAHKAVWEGAKNTYFLLFETARGLWSLLSSAVMGQGSLSSLTGPVGIVKLVGDASALGLTYLIGFTALISVNLAIINMIPIPALDGGRLFFILIEWLKGSPIKPNIANAVNAVGFVLLMILMVVITYRDIARLVAG